MIHLLENRDIEAVCRIVNQNWINVYTGLVGPSLLDPDGCAERTRQLKADFTARRFSEYVWDENGQAVAIMSFGDAGDADAAEALEIWRLYVAAHFQRLGIGRQLMNFAEQQADALGRKRIVIWAFKENRRAVSFYQKNGYRIDKEKFLGEPYCAAGVRLVKELSP